WIKLFVCWIILRFKNENPFNQPRTLRLTTFSTFLPLSLNAVSTNFSSVQLPQHPITVLWETRLLLLKSRFATILVLLFFINKASSFMISDGRIYVLVNAKES